MMNNFRMAKTLSFMAISALFAPCALAQSTPDSSAPLTDTSTTTTTTTIDPSGWYFGANVGQSKAKIDDANITQVLTTQGAVSLTIDNRDRSTGYKVFGGYQFNEYISIEGGYFDLGKFGYTATTVPAGTVNGDIKLKGANLDLVGFIPLSENFSAFGRVGGNYSQAVDNFSSTGSFQVINPNPSKKDWNAKVGLGLQYHFTPALAVRLEAERYRVDDAIGNKGDVDLYSIGLVYRFGEKTQVHTVTHVAAPPPPPPEVIKEIEVVVVPVAAPVPPPQRVKVSFSADTLYEFNKSDIKLDGKLALDHFTAELKGTRYDMIRVIGNTDRIGSHESNMILSTSRADKVKEYLIETGGIPRDKIEAVGVDGSDPVTKPGDCVGNKVTKKLIECLQPDRRVDIEVTGSQKK